MIMDMNEDQYDGMCEIVWPATSPATLEHPDSMTCDGMMIYDSHSGEQLVTVTGMEICLGGEGGWNPNAPITVKITALADEDGHLLAHSKPIVYESSVVKKLAPKTGEYLYLVTKMYVAEL